MPTFDGFLGTRATFMVDVVTLAMILVLPVLGWSVYLARDRRRFALHKRIQLVLSVVLLVTVCLFEVDIRLHGWRDRASLSAYSGHDGGTNWVRVALTIHLCFAVTTFLLWIAVVFRAVRRFSRPPEPGSHSAWHRRFGLLAAAGMLGTAITGWIFYWAAFVA